MMAGTLLIQVVLPARQQQHHHQVEVPTYSRGRVAPGKTLEREIQIQRIGRNTISNEHYEHWDVQQKLAADVYFESSTFGGGTRQQPQ